MNPRIRISHGLITAALLCAFTLGGAAMAAAETVGGCEAFGDASDSAASATSLSTPAVCVGELSATWDEDWYAFSVVQGQTIEISVDKLQTFSGPQPGHIALDLIDPAGGDFKANLALACNRDDAGCHVALAMGGTWKVGLSESAPPAGYELNIALLPPPPAGSHCESGGDAGDSASSATSVSTPKLCVGAVNGNYGAGTDEDWYSFVTSPGDTYAIGVASEPWQQVEIVHLPNLEVQVFDPSGTDVTAAQCTGVFTPGKTNWGEPIVCSRLSGPVGTWKVRIFQAGGYGYPQQDPYVLSIAVAP